MGSAAANERADALKSESQLLQHKHNGRVASGPPRRSVTSALSAHIGRAAVWRFDRHAGD